VVWSCSCRYRQLLIGLCLFLSVFPLVTHILLEFNHMRCGITTRGLHIIRHGEPVDGLEPGVVLVFLGRSGETNPFHKTVLYLAEHDEGGSIALILNTALEGNPQSDPGSPEFRGFHNAGDRPTWVPRAPGSFGPDPDGTKQEARWRPPAQFRFGGPVGDEQRGARAVWHIVHSVSRTFMAGIWVAFFPKSASDNRADRK